MHDPLQFAYQPDIGVDDAVIYLLHTSLTHLEKAGSTVRIMFFDFSSAFNTIQPRLLGDKLQLAGVDHHLTTWILDYLTHRPQFVRVQGFESDRLLCSTGAPQGTVLAPFLFTLYTADFSYNTPSCHLQKFSDDSAVVGLITDGDDREYRGLIQGLCGLVPAEQPPDQRCLDWSDNTNALVKKGNSRLFLLRRLRSFGVQGPLLRTFYDSVVASAIFYGIVCWASSITDRDRRRMDRLDTLTALGSSFSERLLHPRCVKESSTVSHIFKRSGGRETLPEPVTYGVGSAMNQCEDREEGVPPSKTSLCGEHDSQTKAQRPEQQRPDCPGPGPGPGPSCVSLKSDQSIGRFFEFKDGQQSDDEMIQHERPDCPETGPSCVSLKSD
ncbi:hypothetical protein L3Q82_001533 [Scortum barcoo]|uniref:Uncharacterized protein n=1 Tax=Scortum barcoo TaxID=214431 RepID=A0ACB8W872_9TELE|nr:hypothetical protein L3Q82_001533 [Scortum barcoo]